MKILLKCILVMLSFLLLTCGMEEPNSSLQIYGGKPVRSGWQSAVGITDNKGLFCSGTVVHPKLVITAAHCVKGSRGMRVYVGNGRDGGKVQGQYRVKSARISPKYKGKDNDIAYLLMANTIKISKSDIPKILFKKSEINKIIRKGNKVVLVGFGERENKRSGSKYMVSAPIKKVNQNEVSIGGNGKDSCYGDSGGPAYGYIGKSLRVFGVVSRGGKCGRGGIWGRMDANACWIQNSSKINLNLNC